MSNLIICIIVQPRLIDFNECRFLQLEHAEKIKIKNNAFGFLPNGDLIIVSLNDKLKDKMYSFKNKPATNTTLWKCSQIYDIEIPAERLKDGKITYFICQTKLFLIYGNRLMTQWNLLTMTFDMQYFIDDYPYNIVTNKKQTLLALGSYNKMDVFSMENGTLISSYG